MADSTTTWPVDYGDSRERFVPFTRYDICLGQRYENRTVVDNGFEQNHPDIGAVAEAAGVDPSELPLL